MSCMTTGFRGSNSRRRAAPNNRLVKAMLVHQLVALVDQQGDFLLDFHFRSSLSIDILSNAVVLVGQIKLRTILIDVLLHFGNGTISLAAETAPESPRPERGCRPSSWLLPREPRRLGISFAHGAGVRFLVGQVCRNLAGQQLLLGDRFLNDRRRLTGLRLGCATARRAIADGPATVEPWRHPIHCCGGRLQEQLIRAFRVVGPERRLALLDQRHGRYSFARDRRRRRRRRRGHRHRLGRKLRRVQIKVVGARRRTLAQTRDRFLVRGLHVSRRIAVRIVDGARRVAVGNRVPAVVTGNCAPAGITPIPVEV